MESIDVWLRENPVVVGLGLLALIISLVLTIAGGAERAIHFYNARLKWRSAEYEKLTSLHAGFSMAKFQEVLGEPTFVRQAGVLQESTFMGSKYWVQTISDASGSVQLYAVTACDGFEPKFVSAVGNVTLNRTRLSDVSSTAPKTRYFVSGATANSFIYDEHGMGNPTQYKVFYVGLNDACRDIRSLPAVQLLAKNGYWDSRARKNDKEIIGTVREMTIVNTFAETAPLVMPPGEADEPWKPFQIGADRILTRTTW